MSWNTENIPLIFFSDIMKHKLISRWKITLVMCNPVDFIFMPQWYVYPADFIFEKKIKYNDMYIALIFYVETQTYTISRWKNQVQWYAYIPLILSVGWLGFVPLMSYLWPPGPPSQKAHRRGRPRVRGHPYINPGPSTPGFPSAPPTPPAAAMLSEVRSIEVVLPCAAWFPSLCSFGACDLRSIVRTIWYSWCFTIAKLFIYEALDLVFFIPFFLSWFRTVSLCFFSFWFGFDCAS